MTNSLRVEGNTGRVEMNRCGFIEWLRRKGAAFVPHACVSVSELCSRGDADALSETVVCDSVFIHEKLGISGFRLGAWFRRGRFDGSATIALSGERIVCW